MEPYSEFARILIQKALEYGADMAGFASADDLYRGPSEVLFPKIKDHARDRFAQQITTGLPHSAVKWEADEKSVLVFAVHHPEDKPEMDWWVGEINPPDPRTLIPAGTAMPPAFRIARSVLFPK